MLDSDSELVIEAVERLSCLSMFPSGAGARTEIMRVLMRLVEDRSKLNWLVDTMIDQVGEWKGPKELRAVYCTRFKPQDGVEAYSAIPGFRADDIEAERVQPMLEASGAVLQLASAAEMKMLPLPPEEIEANIALTETVREIMRRADDKSKPFMRVPSPTAEDRAYSRKLLEGIL